MDKQNAMGREILYHINGRDEIVFVDDAWDHFAVANGGENVVSFKVLHRSLWDFVADQTTRELYRQILKQVRRGEDG